MMGSRLRLVLATITLVVVAALASGLEVIALAPEPAPRGAQSASVAPLEVGASLLEDDRDEVDALLAPAPAVEPLEPAVRAPVARPRGAPPPATASPARPKSPRPPPA